MDEVATLVQRYPETWNEPDSDARLAAIRELWAEDGTYVDPLANVAGHTQISNLIAAVQGQVPGARVRLRDGVDALTEDGGRIRNVLGFLDKAPAD